MITIETPKGTNLTFKVIQFSGGERHIQLDDTILDVEMFENGLLSFTIRAKIFSSDDIMDLLMVTNALQKAFPKAILDLEIPYLPYARQDRVAAGGQAFSLNVFTDILKICNFRRIITWDVHSWISLALCGGTLVSVNPAEIILQHSGLLSLIRDRDTVLIAPDKGAFQRVNAAAIALGAKSFHTCDKKRNPTTGAIEGFTMDDCDLRGKTCVIIDDICDGGWTFTECAKALRYNGAKSVILFVTHGIFSKGLNALDGFIDHTYTSNSRQDDKHPIPGEASDKLTIIPFKYNFQGA